MVLNSSSDLSPETKSSTVLFTEKTARGMSMSMSTECHATQCCCNHTDSHFLVRCGCPNDKPSSHPMHDMDDAFHREWCTKCLRFCYQPPNCRYVCVRRPVLRGPLLYIAAVFGYLAPPLLTQLPPFPFPYYRHSPIP
ncbi:hypothetical protein K435DRAFT_861553 [Dendrothele bispora CBS 962.96]|uniref:Uncharacterized protein n=1 Tax=Dendrothele bispora (strain CBS 962.96) TaxID=1314807 RepID=A0A4S8LV15_DENBC|nr:hypothetical protein K435DRAFT_861553 [Dendrothele bispora CBS 962.96]